jgi:integrase
MRGRASQVFRIAMEDAGLAWVDELEDADGIRRVDDAIPGRSLHARRALLLELRRALRLGLGWYLVRREPPFPDFVRLCPTKLPRATPRPMAATPEDVDRLLEYLERQYLGEGADAWKARRLHALAATVAYAGIAVRQARRLDVADVDLVGGVIRVRGTRRARRGADPLPIRIDDRLRAILAGWLPLAGCDSAFPGARRRGPWVYASDPSWGGGALYELEAAGRAAGIRKPITFEALRLHHAEHAVLSPPVRAAPAARPESATSSRPAPAARPGSAASDPGSGPSVQLGRPGEPVIVRGRSKMPLAAGQYKIISTLLEVWPDGLSQKAMTVKYGGKVAWRQLLIRLRKDPDWAAAIAFPGAGFPGMPSGMYRII